MEPAEPAPAGGRGARLRVDLGVFAHNEAAGIGAMIAGLARQTIWDRPDIDLRVVVLENGSTDDTADRARAAAAAAAAHAGRRFDVAELAQGGKSRTWNNFVHGVARPDAGILVFADGDIELPAADTLERLVSGLAARPDLAAFSSRPMKDLVLRPELRRGLTTRLIAGSAGTLDDWRTALSGSLYALRGEVARDLHLPIGLPVEDGFLRAMILTDGLEGPEDLSRIATDEGIFHIYESERGLAPLIRHQVRIVIGGSLNEALFRHLADQPPGTRKAELARAGADEGWIGRVAAARLPKAPWGYVPAHFLVKRLRTLGRDRARRRSPRALTLAALGFGFDLAVYLAAQVRMARGHGPGFW